ncbi:MAG: hypothetical protein KDD70_13790, partial [Bdellovibrionales bacterium]|nr:hypothetical protein [Bdellovibrionales bacterium]
MRSQFELSSLFFFFVLCLASLLGGADFLGEAYATELSPKCTHKGDYDSVTFFLLDRTDKLEDTRGLETTLDTLKSMIDQGERLVVGVNTDKQSEARIILDMVRPKKTLMASVLKIRAEQKLFDECFNEMRVYALSQTEDHKQSALLETMRFIGKTLQASTSSKKRLVIHSDMIQNSTAISFWKGDVNPDSSMKQVEKKFLLSKLDNVEVHVAGAGHGVSDEKARAI